LRERDESVRVERERDRITYQVGAEKMDEVNREDGDVNKDS
jgi:hypothetical protein